MSRPVCILVGPPGAGKSSVGRLVAQRLGVEFRDTDDDIESLAEKPIPDIFLDDGEPAFRAMERDAVAHAVDEHPGVLALGGGAVGDPGTRTLLAGLPVVQLTVSLHDATKRVGWGPGRPMLDLNPRAKLAELMKLRQPLYDEVSVATIDTTGRSLDEVASAVIDALAAATAS